MPGIILNLAGLLVVAFLGVTLFHRPSREKFLSFITKSWGQADKAVTPDATPKTLEEQLVFARRKMRESVTILNQKIEQISKSQKAIESEAARLVAVAESMPDEASEARVRERAELLTAKVGRLKNVYEAALKRREGMVVDLRAKEVLMESRVAEARALASAANVEFTSKGVNLDISAATYDITDIDREIDRALSDAEGALRFANDVERNDAGNRT